MAKNKRKSTTITTMIEMLTYVRRESERERVRETHRLRVREDKGAILLLSINQVGFKTKA